MGNKVLAFFEISERPFLISMAVVAEIFRPNSMLFIFFAVLIMIR